MDKINRYMREINETDKIWKSEINEKKEYRNNLNTLNSEKIVNKEPLEIKIERCMLEITNKSNLYA